MQFSRYYRIHIKWIGGDKEDRTLDLLLAKQALSQLSYAPIFKCIPKHLLDMCNKNTKLKFKTLRLCFVLLEVLQNYNTFKNNFQV